MTALDDGSLSPNDRALAVADLARALVVDGTPDDARVLLDDAFVAASNTNDTYMRAVNFVEILQAQVDSAAHESAAARIDLALATAREVSDSKQRADLVAKAAVLYAKLGYIEAANTAVASIALVDASAASYKARAIHDIAPELAAQGDISAARELLKTMDFGLTYYKAAASAEVSVFAFYTNDKTSASALLSEAESIARAQENGYFIAGALRRIADAYFDTGRSERSADLMRDAIAGARVAPSLQEQARALSRIATTLADQREFADARSLVADAISLARRIDSPVLRGWCLYEIAGAAAFSGDNEAAQTLVSEIPHDLMLSGKSVRAAADRDVAWGLARHGNVQAALDHAALIARVRERVQALSRIHRVAIDPDMKALPRYL
ncbi:MAG: hypothetical protein AAF004_14885 [Pseudomonadota bacterium]